MKRRIVYFALFIAAALAGAQAPNPLPTYWPWTGVTPAPVPITASAIADEFGNPYSNVSLCFTPVDGNGKTTGFRVGPVQVMAVRRCGLVSSGALAAGLSLAPTPTGIYYHPEVIDRKTGNVLRDYCATAITGSSWTLDSYDCAPPNAPPPTAGSIGAAATGQLAIYVGASPTTTLAGIPFQGLLNTGSMLTTGITSSGAPTATCDAAHLFVKAYDLTNLGQEYTCLQKTDSSYAWQLTAGGGSSSGGGDVTTINTSLPVSTYSIGSGMCHITDSTGPGNGLVQGSATELLFAAYNGQGCNSKAQQYPGTWYCNQGASSDCQAPKGSGNATSADTFSQQLYPNEDPPDTGAYDYFFQHGFGDVATCRNSFSGWGHFYGDCTQIITAGLYAGYAWAGTANHMKLRASAAAQSGTATFAPPASFAAGNYAPGTPMCATTGGTLTFQTMPATGVIWYTWIVSGQPGTDTANVFIDGTAIGSISSGAGGGWGTNWESVMWWGQRFVIPNSNTGSHTLAITTTSGNFCSVFAITPGTEFNGLEKPNVYESGYIPGAGGFLAAYEHDVYQNAALQAKADGLHVEFSDLFGQGWPEGRGDTRWFEYNNGTYPGGLVCTGQYSPHYNNCGNLFNAWQFLRSAGRTPSPTPNVSGDGSTVICTPNGKSVQCAAGAGVARMATPNNFTTGEQHISTGAATTKGLTIQGKTGVVTPTIASNNGGSHCNGTDTFTFGAGNLLVIGTDNAAAAPTSSGGETFTLVADLQQGWLHAFWIAPNLAGGSETITWNAGYFCNVTEFANASTAANPLDGSAVKIIDPAGNSAPKTVSITTTQPNDLLVTIDTHDNADAPSGGSWVELYRYGNQSAFATETAATPGAYSATWGHYAYGDPNSWAIFAIKGATGTQLVDLQGWQTPDGVTHGAIDGPTAKYKDYDAPAAATTCSHFVNGVLKPVSPAADCFAPETHTASNSSELDFTSCLSAGVQNYQLNFTGLYAASGNYFVNLQFWNGTAYDTTAADYSTSRFFYQLLGGTGQGNNYAVPLAGIAIEAQANTWGADTGTTVANGTLILHVPTNLANDYVNIDGAVVTRSGATTQNAYHLNVSGLWNQNITPTKFRLIPEKSGDTIAGGVVTCQPLAQ